MRPDQNGSACHWNDCVGSGKRLVRRQPGRAGGYETKAGQAENLRSTPAQRRQKYEQATHGQLPGSAERDVECLLWIDRDEVKGGQEAEQRDEADRCDRRRLAAAREPVRKQHQSGPQEVELLFHAQRPKMQKGQQRRVAVEIAGVPEEIVVSHAASRKRSAAPQAGIVAGEQQKPTRNQRKANHGQQSRENSPHAAAIEFNYRQLAAFGEQQPGDQVARDHKEYVDANETAGEPRRAEMKKDYGDHRNCAQAVDVGPIVRLHHVPLRRSASRRNLTKPPESRGRSH